jgi:hypothetical protein
MEVKVGEGGSVRVLTAALVAVKVAGRRRPCSSRCEGDRLVW